MEVIKDVISKQALWSNQAQQLLASFSDQILFKDTMELLLYKLKDRHSRFILVSQFPERACSFYSSMMQTMGQMYDFSFYNPNGHYQLNLGKPF